MKSTKFYKLVIVALVIINLTTISFMFFGRKGPRHRPPGGLTKVLNFEGKQRALIQKLEKDHHTEKRALMQKSKNLYFKLYQNIGNEKYGSLLLDSLEANNNYIDSMTYAFFNEISEHCNEEQVIELHKAIEHGIGHLWSKKTPR